MDPDELPRLKGAESDYYLSLSPPYVSKNGPIDDLSELLLVQGITPEMYWGSAGSNVSPGLLTSKGVNCGICAGIPTCIRPSPA